MPSIAFDFWLNIATAVGIGILSVPAFSLNFRKKTVARITSIVSRRTRGNERQALDTIAEELESEASMRANRWRRIDEIFLFLGYFLLLGASVARVFIT